MRVIYCRLIGVLPRGNEAKGSERGARAPFKVFPSRRLSERRSPRRASRVQVTSLRPCRRDISADQGSLETFRFAIYQARRIFLRVLIETCLTVSRSPRHRRLYLECISSTATWPPRIFSVPLRSDIKSSSPSEGGKRGRKVSTFFDAIRRNRSFPSFLFCFFFSFSSLPCSTGDSRTDVVNDRSLSDNESHCSRKQKKTPGRDRSESFTSTREIEFARDAWFSTAILRFMATSVSLPRSDTVLPIKERRRNAAGFRSSLRFPETRRKSLVCSFLELLPSRWYLVRSIFLNRSCVACFSREIKAIVNVSWNNEGR